MLWIWWLSMIFRLPCRSHELDVNNREWWNRYQWWATSIIEENDEIKYLEDENDEKSINDEHQIVGEDDNERDINDEHQVDEKRVMK